MLFAPKFALVGGTDFMIIMIIISQWLVVIVVMFTSREWIHISMFCAWIENTRLQHLN